MTFVAPVEIPARTKASIPEICDAIATVKTA
jgi:hypothetical protein